MFKLYSGLLGALLAFAGSVDAAKEVQCVCNNKTVQAPLCGICGSDAGTMEQTKNGALCICDNKLQSQEASCADACAADGGWSGDFSS